MGKKHHNSIFNNFLVLCLGIALVLGQSGRFHMHVLHDPLSSATSMHILDIHPESTVHNIELTNHHDEHHDVHNSDHNGDHPTIVVDVSPDQLLKNAGLLNPLVVIFFFFGFILYIPGQRKVPRQKLYKIFFAPCYYLFRPPLRAPPV